MPNVTILGATGSIGVNTLDVISQHQDRYKVFALTANSNVEVLAKQCIEWNPKYAVMADEASADQLEQRLRAQGVGTEVLAGLAGHEYVARHAETDYVMAAIVGAAGLLPTLAAARAGKRVLLANKEALVMAGEIFVRETKRTGVRLLPVDSEHSAVFQCLQGNHREEVERLILTASGGPFLRVPLKDLDRATVKQALRHPNWKMGPKITVDSATMMNKGLEVVEAHWLFDMTPAQVEVVIHPQSIVHSMVRYQDGSVIAQLGVADMRLPIQYALSYPERLPLALAPVDFVKLGALHFGPMDMERYPCLGLALAAGRRGGTCPAALAGADEAAVAAFLDGRLRFVDIPRLLADTLDSYSSPAEHSLDAVLEADAWGRRFAREWIEAHR